MYGGSFLYHVGGGQSVVSLGLVVSHCLSLFTAENAVPQ